MIFHENRLQEEDSHEISCLICYFLKSRKILNCRLLQIIDGTLWVYLHQYVSMNLWRMRLLQMTSNFYVVDSLFIVAPIVPRDSVFVPCFIIRYFVSF